MNPFEWDGVSCISVGKEGVGIIHIHAAEISAYGQLMDEDDSVTLFSPGTWVGTFFPEERIDEEHEFFGFHLAEIARSKTSEEALKWCST